MSIYNVATLGESDNLLTFNDYTTNPVYRAMARSANKFAIRQQDLPVPFESGSSDFLTLLGDTSYIIQGKMYPADEPSYDAGLMALRSVCSLTLNQADVLSTDGYVPYIWQDFFNKKQIFMKPLYVEISETTQQGFVQPFTILAKIIDPVIYAADLSVASTGNAVASTPAVLTNLIPNPSFEAATTGWVSYNGGVVSQSSAQAFSGTKSASVVTSGGGSTNEGIIATTITGLTTNTQYVASAYLYVANGVTVTLEIDTFTSIGGYVQTVLATVVGNGAWQRVYVPVELGATETEVNILFYTTSSTTFYLDAVMFQTGSIPTTYFDGSLAGTSLVTYAWTGTANNSASTQSTANGTALYSFGYPVLYGASAFSVSADCNNIGTLPVWPVSIIVTGPVTNPKVTNLATGEFIQVNVTLNSPTDQLNITYNASTQDINLNGVNVANQMVTGSTLFKIHPGTNTIQLSGGSVGTGAIAEVEFFSGWPMS